MRRLSFIVVLSSLLTALSSCCSNNQNIVDLQLNSEDGTIVSLSFNGTDIPFRIDEHRGPRFCEDSADGIERSVTTCVEDGHVVVRCSIKNCTDSTYTPLRERLKLGIDCEMLSYPQWDGQMFPTLIRCEKDYCWGYFSSPDGKILAFASEDPVASYANNYVKEELLSWEWGHQIKTSSLDLLHEGPLPERHPHDRSSLDAGCSLDWTIHFGLADSLEDVKKLVAKWSGAASIECSAYIVEEGGSIRVNTEGNKFISKAIISKPDGCTDKRYFIGSGFTLNKLKEKGLYKISVISRGKMSEAMVYVREPWSWYVCAARDFQLRAMPRIGNSCESFYGFFPAFAAAQINPCQAKDSVFYDLLDRAVPNMMDTLTWLPAKNCQLKDRIQNFSSLAGVYCERWKATGDSSALRAAGGIADYVCSFQAEDGSLRNNGIHYTAVIYPAKSLFDVADAERSAGLTDRAETHSNVAMKACVDLMRRLDDIETEGDMTFEDGMISCSALQIAYAALHCDDTILRDSLTNAARYMMKKHECLEQRLIPDCRMRGATLRYWEALDLYFSPNQVMNSPHGWTAWKTYADYYLYLLTGEEKYKKDYEETLGACIQTMNLEGFLRWGFMPDPYIKARMCVPDENNHISYRTEVIGEQYMDLISTWCRPENDNDYVCFSEEGGEGDGTVYEIYKAVAEIFCGK